MFSLINYVENDDYNPTFYDPTRIEKRHISSRLYDNAIEKRHKNEIRSKRAEFERRKAEIEATCFSVKINPKSRSIAMKNGYRRFNNDYDRPDLSQTPTRVKNLNDDAENDKNTTNLALNSKSRQLNDFY